MQLPKGWGHSAGSPTPTRAPQNMQSNSTEELTSVSCVAIQSLKGWNTHNVQHVGLKQKAWQKTARQLMLQVSTKIARPGKESRSEKASLFVIT